MTVDKLLNLSVSTHLPPALGSCPATDPAAHPLRVVTAKARKYPRHRSFIWASRVSWDESVLSFPPHLTSSALLSQEAKAPLKYSISLELWLSQVRTWLDPLAFPFLLEYPMKIF